MKNAHRTIAFTLVFVMSLFATVPAFSADMNHANKDTTSLNAGAKTIPAGQKGRISISDLELEFAEDLAVDKIELVTVGVGNGAKKDQKSYTAVEAFNSDAASIAKKVAKAGDELHITMYLPDGRSNRYAIKLSR